MEGTESLHPIAVLVTELKAEDVGKRVKSLAQLPTISIALGPERTVAELLPYLTELIDDEPQVQLELAHQLSTFTSYIGGKNYSHLLFDSLEMLASVDDSEVRNTAVRGIMTIADSVDSDVMREIVLDIGKTLAAAEGVSARCSACLLLALLHSHLSKAGQHEALELYESLAKDTSSHVRKAAVDTFPSFQFKSSLYDLLGLFASDREDAIRISAVTALVSATSDIPTGKRSSLLSSLRNLCEDKALRVRIAVAEHIPAFAAAFGADITVQVLSPLCVRLLSDSESQVRTSMCERLSDFVVCMSPEQTAVHILPIISSLTLDTDTVKKSFAEQISKLTLHLGQKLMREFLLPAVKSLLTDINVEVSLCIFRGSQELVTYLEPSELHDLMTSLLRQIMKDAAWRSRLQVCELIPMYIKRTQLTYFIDTIEKLLSDNTFTVRDLMVHKLKEIAEIVGAENTEEQLFPCILTLKQGKNYITRMTLLKAVAVLAPFVSLNYLKTAVFPVLESLALDKVPHVRLNVGRTVTGLMAVQGDVELEDGLRQVWERLKTDTDPDVRMSVPSSYLSS